MFSRATLLAYPRCILHNVYLVRPNKIIYVFPITPAKKLGSVGTKTHFILLNYFIASKLRVGTNVKNIFALACKFHVNSTMSKFNSKIS